MKLGVTNGHYSHFSSVPGGRDISVGLVAAARTEELRNRGSIHARTKIFIF